MSKCDREEKNETRVQRQVPANTTATMRKYNVGDRILVKLSGGRIVEATIKAVVETTEGARLQLSFGDETALIYPWQIVIEAR